MTLAISVVVALAFQGARPVWDPDEGRYTDIAQQMLDRHDWLVPHLDPERPHFAKPPLTYWVLASSFQLFGRNAWAARIPNALAFVLTALLVLGIARRAGFQRPWIAACVWATAWGPVMAANAVTTDTLLALFETAAIYAFFRSGLPARSGPPDASGIRMMWLAFGLAFLTKGPPGLLPLLGVLVFMAWRRRSAVRSLFDVSGLLAFLVLGGGWYLVVVMRVDGLWDYLLAHEVIGRVATGEHHRNPGWFGWALVYGPTLLFGSLPWLPIVCIQWWRKRRGQAAPMRLEPDVQRFLLLWAGVPLFILCLAQSRLPLYVLPLFVPLMLLLAVRLQSLDQLQLTPVKWFALAALLATGLRFGIAQVPSEHDARALAQALAGTVALSGVDRIVFVDATPRYGLKLYLARDVIQAESAPDEVSATGYSHVAALCDELARPGQQLLFVPRERVGVVTPRLEGCAPLVETLGELREWSLYLVTRRPRGY